WRVSYKTAKDIWDAIQITYEGTKDVWEPKSTTIQEAYNMKTLTLDDELLEALNVHEVNLQKREIGYKGPSSTKGRSIKHKEN
ncbi:hypothetical protein CR513_48295, partial [Mucuna pruriens]